jgi:hypothetical protein
VVEVPWRGGGVVAADDDRHLRRPRAHSLRHSQGAEVLQARPAGDPHQRDLAGECFVELVEQRLERCPGDVVQLEDARLGQIAHIAGQTGEMRLVAEVVLPPALPVQHRWGHQQQGPAAHWRSSCHRGSTDNGGTLRENQRAP